MPKALTTADLDDISLAQALVDFEVANARVIDLTARLAELTTTNLDLRREVADLRGQLAHRAEQMELLDRVGVFSVLRRLRNLKRRLRV